MNPLLGEDDAPGPTQSASPSPAAIELGGRVTLAELEAEHVRRILLSTTSLEEAARIWASTQVRSTVSARRLGL